MTEREPSARTESPAHGHVYAARLVVLRLMDERPELSQRELASAWGLSLGTTHHVLHSLLDRAMVKAGNFRRSGSKLAYTYLLTPGGIREKMCLRRQFLVRKETQLERLQHTIAALRDEFSRAAD